MMKRRIDCFIGGRKAKFSLHLIRYKYKDIKITELYFALFPLTQSTGLNKHGIAE